MEEKNPPHQKETKQHIMGGYQEQKQNMHLPLMFDIFLQFVIIQLQIQIVHCCQWEGGR